MNLAFAMLIRAQLVGRILHEFEELTVTKATLTNPPFAVGVLVGSVRIECISAKRKFSKLRNFRQHGVASDVLIGVHPLAL